LIFTPRPIADAAIAAGVHGLMVTGWTFKAEGRGVCGRVPSDGADLALAKV
jgi:hypothetical protein